MINPLNIEFLMLVYNLNVSLVKKLAFKMRNALNNHYYKDKKEREFFDFLTCSMKSVNQVLQKKL